MNKWAIEPISEHHDLTAFDCGEPKLNNWLLRFAQANQAEDLARTYIARETQSTGRSTTVCGYYTLVNASCPIDCFSESSLPRGFRNPVPAILLARLAVASSMQGKGLGAALLVDALIRAAAAAEVIAARGMAVDALTPKAKAFYEHYGFESLEDDDLHLFISMHKIRQVVAVI